MASSAETSVGRLPDEMLKFIVDRRSRLTGPRLGRLLSKGRPPLQTPLYVAATSRGVVPHVAEDLLQRHTAVSAVYMGLEDFVEKCRTEAPVFKTPASQDESALRKYTALHSSCLLILGPRRVPALTPTAQNSNTAISISTSVGFRTLEAADYDAATLTLRPDVATGLADLISADKISKKRMEKSADRTHGWLRDTIARRGQSGQLWPPLFASILPLEQQQQQLYLQDLAEEYEPNISGLVAFDADSVALLPASLSHLPRICLSDPHTPQDILHAVSLGVDLITVPSVTSISEQGLAFSFCFPAPAMPSVARQALVLDMWSDCHAGSCEPLVEGCQCYTCVGHHRAYVYHLLQTKEMLAWTLLQIHNFHVLNRFFGQVRESIMASSFDADMQRFKLYYEDAIVAGDGKGRGPRTRGYHLKSNGGDPKRNEKKWGRFENGTAHAITAEADDGAVPEAGIRGESLESV
ncbi:hypothetical protein DV736_g5564, partial [Chaetothyriales sp. CBS 134916]